MTTMLVQLPFFLIAVGVREPPRTVPCLLLSQLLPLRFHVLLAAFPTPRKLLVVLYIFFLVLLLLQ